MIIGLVLGWAHAACEQAATTREVAEALQRAEASFSQLDVEAFQSQVAHAHDLLPCIAEPVDPGLAAQLHRLTGMDAFSRRDAELATRAFAASRSLQPGYLLPQSLVPEGHPIREQYILLDIEQKRVQAVGAPVSGRIAFDGSQAVERPQDWPTVFQRFENTGRLADTAYVKPGEPLPEYAAKRPPSKLTKPLWISTASAAAVTGGLLAGAVLSRSAYDTAGLAPSEDLDPLRGRTNSLLVASAVSSGVTLASGVGAAIVTRW